MFFFQFGGVTVFVIGVWTLIDKSFINDLLGTNLFMGAVYILIATGGLVAIVSFFGCLGAAKEVKCMLLTVRKIIQTYFVACLNFLNQAFKAPTLFCNLSCMLIHRKKN